MRIRKTLAALAIATTAMAGIGAANAGTASATLSGSDSNTSHVGTWYQVYVTGGNTVGWFVNVGSTDERMYLSAEDTCGNVNTWNWNDVSESGWNNAHYLFPCPVAWAKLYPTNDGVQDGRTVTR